MSMWVYTALFVFFFTAQLLMAEALHPDLLPLLEGAAVGESVAAAIEVDGEIVGNSNVEVEIMDEMSDEEGLDLECGLVRDLTKEGQEDGENVPLRECCRVGKVSEGFEIKCMPSFIIAGTQKSGTTVLSAFLAKHPSVSFARKKELHFFSNDKYYKKGLVSGYLDYFRKWNYTEPKWTHRPPHYGEATPYYLASRKACPRMANTVGGDLRLIVLLREPVARAYSEYQMKIRRVQQQNEFISFCELYALDLYDCLSQEDSHSAGTAESEGKLAINWKRIKRCTPAAIKEHFHWSKFVSALEDHAARQEKWSDLVSACFSVDDSGSGSGSSSSSGTDDGTSAPVVPKFLAKACLKKHAKERVTSIDEAFFSEIEDFHRCVHNESTTVVQPQHFYLHGMDSPAAVDRQVDRCLHVKSGISSQYVYRSLYVAQLYHCLKHFHRHQLLVLPSERLKKSPQSVYEQVLRFIGVDVDKEGSHHLPSLDSQSASSSEKEEKEGEKESHGEGDETDAVTEAVKKNFPVFERNTGWRLHGDYEPMAAKPRERLREYFHPFNEMLFDFLGERFSEWE